MEAEKYTKEHGTTWETLQEAGCTLTTYQNRKAIIIPTASGNRYRFLDNEKPKYTSDKGYERCWFGLERAVEMGSVLVLANGEISTIAAQGQGIPAACITAGEKAEMPQNLLKKLLRAYQGNSIIIVADCDDAGHKAAHGIAKQLRAWYDSVRVVSLPFEAGSGKDLADWCKHCLDTDTDPLKIYDLPDLPEPEPEPQPRANDNGYGGFDDEHIKDEIKQHFDMLEYARQAWPDNRIDDRPSRKGEYEIHGMGGMYINPDKRSWYNHSEDFGGDCLNLIAYDLFRDPSRTRGDDFKEILEKAARFAGVTLPEKTQRRNGNGHYTNGNGAIQKMPSLAAGAEDQADDPRIRQPHPLTEVKVEPFPLHTIPGWLRDYIQAVAEQLEIDPGMAALVALVVLSTIFQRRYVILVKGGNAPHFEPLSLWGIVGAESGEAKTPTLASMTFPLHDYAKEYNEAIYKQYEEHIKSRDDKAKPSEEPHTLTLALTDATPESLPDIMKEQGERAGVFAGEAAAFLNVHLGGKYNGGNGDVAILNSSWSGESVNVARRKEKRRVSLRNPALAITLMIQPGVLAHLAKNPIMRSSGFLARFIYCIPDSNVGYRTFDKPEGDGRAREKYEQHITAMLRNCYPAQYPIPATEKPRTLHLSPEAAALRKEYRLQIEEKLRPTSNESIYRDWHIKAIDQLTRIAGILALANDNDKTISEADIENAARIVEWSARHMERGFKITAGVDLRLAQRASAWIVKKGKRTITVRDIHRGLHISPDDAAGVIETLEEYGHIWEDYPQRSKATTYTINPLLFN